MTADQIAGHVRARWVGAQFLGHCPGPLHRRGDRNPSLSIREGDGGRVLLFCHAGCSIEQICAAMGLRLRDLFGVDFSQRKRPDEIQEAIERRERVNREKWRVYDAIVAARKYYTDGLLRAERLQARIGAQGDTEPTWALLARIVPVSTLFLAGFTHINALDGPELVRFCLQSQATRRAEIEGSEVRRVAA